MNEFADHNLIYPDPNGIRDGEDLGPEERSILSHVNRKVAGGNSLEEVVDFLFEETKTLMPCDRIAVAFLEEEGSRLVLYYVRAGYEPLFLGKGYTSEIRGSSLERIFSSGYPRILNDLVAYGREHPESESTGLLLREGVRSSMTCPLRVNGRLVGLLFRSSRRPGSYGGREIRMHMAVSERLSQAVGKAFRIDRLSSVIHSYMEMLSFVTHELKSPLASLITLGRTLSEGYFGPLGAGPRDVVERMTKQAEYLHTLTEEYLNLARFERGEFRMNPVQVDLEGGLLTPALEVVSPQIEGAGMKLQKDLPEEKSQVECDPDLFKIVLINLLGNAAKYGREGGVIRLSVSLKDGRLGVSVWNEGPGFPESEKTKLFRRFSRIETPALMRKRGSGIGLYVSWRIVHLHGGKIRAASKEGEWAEFSVEIPQPVAPPDRTGAAVETGLHQG